MILMILNYTIGIKGPKGKQGYVIFQSLVLNKRVDNSLSRTKFNSSLIKISYGFQEKIVNRLEVLYKFVAFHYIEYYRRNVRL